MPFSSSQPFWHLKNVGFSPARLGLLAGAIVLMCLAGLAAMTLAFRTAEAQRWVDQTIEVRQLAGEFLRAVLDVETGVRGYLLSDDKTFLEPYQAAAPKLAATLERLRVLAANDPTQRARLQQISQTSQELNEVYRQMLERAAQGRRDRSHRPRQSARGKIAGGPNAKSRHRL